MRGGTVGKNLYVDKLLEKLFTNQRVVTIISININPRFLYYLINSSIMKNIIKNNKNSINVNIPMNLILNFPVPYPPIEKQQRIVEKIKQLLPLCESLK